MLRDAAKRLVIGTPLEAPIKRAHHALTGEKSSLYDYQTIRIMERVLTRDSNAIDIGAFEGGMLQHMLRLAPGGHHVAFEPQPDRHQRLVAKYPNVTVHPFAVGREAGTATFHCMREHPALSGLSRRERDLPHETATEIRVPVESIDRVIPGDVPVAMVKIDVEGAELDVFRGARNTLRRTRPVVVFECGLGGADYFGAAPGDLFDVVTVDIDLRISLLGGWLAGESPLSRPSFIDRFERRLDFYFVAHG